MSAAECWITIPRKLFLRVLGILSSSAAGNIVLSVGDEHSP